MHWWDHLAHPFHHHSHEPSSSSSSSRRPRDSTGAQSAGARSSVGSSSGGGGTASSPGGPARPEPTCEYCSGWGTVTRTGMHWVERPCSRCNGDLGFRESRICTECNRDNKNCRMCGGRGRYKDPNVKCVQCGGNGCERVQEFGRYTVPCDCAATY